MYRGKSEFANCFIVNIIVLRWFNPAESSGARISHRSAWRICCYITKMYRQVWRLRLLLQQPQISASLLEQVESG